MPSWLTTRFKGRSSQATPFPPEILQHIFSMFEEDYRYDTFFEFPTSRNRLLPLLFTNRTFYDITLPLLFQTLSARDLKKASLRQLIEERSYSHFVQRVFWTLDTDIRVRDEQGVFLERNNDDTQEVSPEHARQVNAGLDSSRAEMLMVMEMLQSFSCLKELRIKVGILKNIHHRSLENDILVLPNCEDFYSLPFLQQLGVYNITLGDELFHNPGAIQLSRFAYSLPQLEALVIKNVPLFSASAGMVALSRNLTSVTFNIRSWMFDNAVDEARCLDEWVTMISRCPLLKEVVFEWCHATLSTYRLNLLCQQLTKVTTLTLGYLQFIDVQGFADAFALLVCCTTLRLTLSADVAEDFLQVVRAAPQSLSGWLPKVSSLHLEIIRPLQRPAAYIGSTALAPLLEPGALPDLKHFSFSISQQPLDIIEQGIRHLLPLPIESLPISAVDQQAFREWQVKMAVVKDFEQISPREHNFSIEGTYYIPTANGWSIDVKIIKRTYTFLCYDRPVRVYIGREILGEINSSDEDDVGLAGAGALPWAAYLFVAGAVIGSLFAR